MSLAVSSPARRPRRRRWTENDDYLAMVRRIVRAAGRRASHADPADLAALMAIRADLDDAILDAVRGLRRCGFTWASIGEALGTTRQAAQLRWGSKLGDE